LQTGKDKEVKSLRILFTGGTGVIGKKLVAKCLGAGLECAVITRDVEKSRKGFKGKVKHIEYGPNRRNLREDILAFDPLVCVHLASYISSESDTTTCDKLIDTNVRFPCFILEALRESGLKYFINTGSFSEFYKGPARSDPAYFYSATKIAFRDLLDSYSIDMGFVYFSIIPYSVYGIRSSTKKAIDVILSSLSNKEPVDMTPGDQALDFIHVDDVCDFYFFMLNNLDVKMHKRTYHLGSGSATTIKDLAKLIEQLSMEKANIRWGGIPYRKKDIMRAVAPVEILDRDTGWRPMIKLRQGLKRYLKQKGSSKKSIS